MYIHVYVYAYVYVHVYTYCVFDIAVGAAGGDLLILMPEEAKHILFDMSVFRAGGHGACGTTVETCELVVGAPHAKRMSWGNAQARWYSNQ